MRVPVRSLQLAAAPLVIRQGLWLVPFWGASLWPCLLLPARSGVLFDFALLCLLLAVTRMHRSLAVLLIFPIGLSAVQLGNWLFTGQLLDIYTLMTFTSTDMTEVEGFTSVLAESYAPWLVLSTVSLMLVLVGFKRGSALPARVLLWAAACAFALFLGLWLVSKHRIPKPQDLGQYTFYGYVTRVTGQFYQTFFEAEATQPDIEDLTHGNGPAVDAILVVIGESTSTYRMSAYGYERETTPFIRRADVIFNDVLAVGLNTQPNVQALVSGEVGVIRQQHAQDIFRVARQSGYVSAYVDNNRFVNRDPMYLIARQADHYDSLNGIGETIPRNDRKIQHDEVVLPVFRSAMQRTHGSRRLLFVHLVGAHFNHDDRYPPAFKRFPSHYDNAVLYTDFILESLHREFMEGTQGQTAMMVYVADHGVKIPPGCGLGDVPAVETANYGNDERYHSNLSVPLAVWFNSALRQKQPERLYSLTRARDLPIDQRFLMWTVADAMGVVQINQRAVTELSLFSPAAQFQPRLNTRGENLDTLLSRGDICRAGHRTSP